MYNVTEVFLGLEAHVCFTEWLLVNKGGSWEEQAQLCIEKHACLIMDVFN